MPVRQPGRRPCLPRCFPQAVRHRFSGLRKREFGHRAHAGRAVPICTPPGWVDVCKGWQEWILQTPRLFLREMTQDDLPALCRTLQDEKAMYAYEHAFSGRKRRLGSTASLDRYRRDGFGLWAVILKETGQMIGQCGITWQDAGGAQVPEIGYLLERAYWHRGYATEAAAACREYAFHTLGISRVYSIIRDTNIRRSASPKETACRPVARLPSIITASICRTWFFVFPKRRKICNVTGLLPQMQHLQKGGGMAGRARSLL